MKEVHLTVRVTIGSDRPRIYRLYVDDDLITERTYIWGRTSSVDENVIVALESGKHEVRVETVIIDPSIDTVDFFRITRLKIDGKIATNQIGMSSLNIVI